MIISHKHRFIFLKTKKTAGTSIEVALNEICGPDDIVTPFLAGNERHRRGPGPRNYQYRPPVWSTEWPNLISSFVRNGRMPLDYYNHIHAWRVKRRVGSRIWNSYFKFAFDRNPWDREVSYYCHQAAQGLISGSFSDHVRRFPQKIVGNYDIYSCNEEVAVDFLGQYENLQADLAKVMEILGLGDSLNLPRANGEFRDRSRPYQEMYDCNLRDIVARTYKREIELLGYTF